MKQLHHVTPVSGCAGIHPLTPSKNKIHYRELSHESGWLIYKQPRRQDSLTRYGFIRETFFQD